MCFTFKRIAKDQVSSGLNFAAAATASQFLASGHDGCLLSIAPSSSSSDAASLFFSRCLACPPTDLVSLRSFSLVSWAFSQVPPARRRYARTSTARSTCPEEFRRVAVLVRRGIQRCGSHSRARDFVHFFIALRETDPPPSHLHLFSEHPPIIKTPHSIQLSATRRSPAATLLVRISPEPLHNSHDRLILRAQNQDGDGSTRTATSRWVGTRDRDATLERRRSGPD